MQWKKILLTLILFRIVCTIFVKTWFVPDETWQSVEIAHHLVYGNGWITWEWKEAIRSYIYPSIFAGMFWILKITNLDFPIFLIHTPRILSAIFFAYGDYCAVRLAVLIYGNASAQWTLKSIISSWFLAYCAPRTLTNCVEMILLTMSLRFYPWHKERECSTTKYLIWTGFGCCIRPTLLLAILPFYLRHLYICERKWNLLAGTSVKVGIVCTISTVVDSMFYGRLVFVPLNFVKFNIINDQASFYGIHPWHWYLTQGIPVICSFHLPFVIMGSFKHFSAHKPLLVASMLLVLIYSFCGHKEFRFLLPILPLLLCISGDYLSKYMRNRNKIRKMILYMWLIVTNLIMFIYMGSYHQRGTVDVVHYLRNYNYFSNKSTENILFLMPCHSTPLYSHLHINIKVRFLTCEPNLKNISDYKDEAEIFFENPQQWFTLFLSNSAIPDCIVMFDSLTPKLEFLMNKQQYSLTASFFFSHFPEGNRGRYVNVFCSNVNIS